MTKEVVLSVRHFFHSRLDLLHELLDVRLRSLNGAVFDRCLWSNSRTCSLKLIVTRSCHKEFDRHHFLKIRTQIYKSWIPDSETISFLQHHYTFQRFMKLHYWNRTCSLSLKFLTVSIWDKTHRDHISLNHIVNTN